MTLGPLAVKRPRGLAVTFRVHVCARAHTHRQTQGLQWGMRAALSGWLADLWRASGISKHVNTLLILIFPSAEPEVGGAGAWVASSVVTHLSLMQTLNRLHFLWHSSAFLSKQAGCGFFPFYFLFQLKIHVLQISPCMTSKRWHGILLMKASWRIEFASKMPWSATVLLRPFQSEKVPSD